MGKGEASQWGFAFTLSSLLKSFGKMNNFKFHETNKKTKHPKVEVEKLAYLRKEKETYEIDYSIAKIWKALPKAMASLEWTIEEIDNKTHHAKVRTKPSFLSYSSTLTIDAAAVKEKTTRVNVTAETTVTTITSIADFGRTQHRIDLFFEAIAKQLTSQTPTR
jgi:hypothetical protein